MMFDNRIISYFDGQLSEKEKLEFENELTRNAKLKSEVEKYKDFLASINSLKDIETDEVYFSNNIPRFREKLEKSKKFKVLAPRFSIVLSTVVAVFIVVFFVLSNKTSVQQNSLSTLIQNANQNDISEAVDSYTNNLNLPDVLSSSGISDTSTSSAINQSFFNELDLSQNDVKKYLNSQNIDYSTMLSSLSSNEVQTLYEELNNKKYY